MAQTIFPGRPTLDPTLSRLLVADFPVPVIATGPTSGDPIAIGEQSNKFTWGIAVPDVTLLHNYGVTAVYEYDDAGHAPDPFYYWAISDGTPDPRVNLDTGSYDGAPGYDSMVGQRFAIPDFPRLQPLSDQDHENPAVAEGQTYFQSCIIINPSGGPLPPSLDITVELGYGWVQPVTVDGSAAIQEAPPPSGKVTLYEWWQPDFTPAPPTPPPPCFHPPWPYTPPYVAADPGPAGVIRLH